MHLYEICQPSMGSSIPYDRTKASFAFCRNRYKTALGKALAECFEFLHLLTRHLSTWLAELVDIDHNTGGPLPDLDT